MNTTIIHGLYDARIIKFGSFTLKDNSTSPYYIDLRLLISYPSLLKLVCSELCALITDKELKYDLIAGVPLAGIPLATLVGVELNAQGLLLRKEAKEHGLKKTIEGVYTLNQTVLLIDDLVTSAASKREVITVLDDHGLVCKDVVVVIDRDCIKNKDFCIHGLFTLTEMVAVLLEYDITSQDRQHLELIANQPTTSSYDLE